MPTRRTRMDAVAGSGYRSLGSLLAPPLESRSAARKRSGCGERRMSAMAKAAPKPTATSTSTDDQERLSGWQQRALDRSLVEAKRRALDKSNGFVKAAMKLLDETGGLHFTVQDVVDRSKLSLRSFYQTFASKDELLLALFEEYVATAADWQREQMAKHDDPVDQIRDFLTSLWVGKLEPRRRARARALQPDAGLDPSRRSRARARAAALGAARRGRARRGGRAGARRRRAAGDSPRSCCTPAPPRCTRRSCAPVPSRLTTCGRSASVVIPGLNSAEPRQRGAGGRESRGQGRRSSPERAVASVGASRSGSRPRVRWSR